MLLLAVLVATAAWSYGYAQEIPVQSPLSVTKSKGSVHLECQFKDFSGDFDGIIIHWYQQKANKAPERMLYVLQTKIVDDGFQAHSLCKKSAVQEILLSIIRLWDADVKIFGSGTKLIVSNKGNSPPANSEILQKKHENQITYVCLIEKFYPEVIRVTWTDEENKEVTDNVVKGDTWKPIREDKYSIGSWLTVPAENKDKNYYCNYEHESQQRSLPTQDSTKTAPQEDDCSTYPGNSTVFNTDHLMHRTAYLVYIVLLLKSCMYYLIVLFFIYRMRAPTKHQGKKA